jgi:hypothetical protein
MGHAKWIEFVYRLLPFLSWKGALLRRHVEKCAICEARLVSRDEARRLMVQADDAEAWADLWPAVQTNIAVDPVSAQSADAREGKRTSAPGWRWAVAFAGLGLAVFMTFAVVAYFRTGPAAGHPGGESAVFAGSAAAGLSLDYVRIGNEPARTLIFKPRGSNMVIVWAEKNQ